MKIKRRTVGIAALLVILAVTAAFAFADPYGPNAVTPGTSTRADYSGIGGKEVAAQAGNVTELTINASVISKRWQGYYGNITGEITLDDASGNTMYDWSGGTGFSPIGEIYAANQTVSSWSDVICLNLTGNGTVGQTGINVTIVEAMYGMLSTDSDGIDETFSGIGDIVIGTNTLTDCPATHTYIDNATQTSYFNETLLTENTEGSVIFGTAIDQNTAGFNGLPWDFQMIVGENGNDELTTSYYFYVELV